jgi:hypothetical protein
MVQHLCLLCALLFFSLPPCCNRRRMNLYVARHFPTCGRIAVPEVRYCTIPHHCKRIDFFPHARVTLTSVTTSAATVPPLSRRRNTAPPNPHTRRLQRPPPHAPLQTQSVKVSAKKSGKWKFNFSRGVVTDSVKWRHFTPGLSPRKTPLSLENSVSNPQRKSASFGP